jgi:thiosulfate dehydrogenase (quinone) large subunit
VTTPGLGILQGVSPGIADSWRHQAWPLRVLRAFLGGTFVYAGAQKFADPNFLHRGTPDFIGAQIAAFERGSPIHWLLAPFGHVAVLTGIAVALSEIAVGLGTLVGVAPIAFAGVGLSINLVLFLSATWHIHPYFLGSDSMYAVGWLALLIGLAEDRVARQRALRRAVAHGTRRQRAEAAIEPLVGRREFLRGAAVGAGTVALGMVATAAAEVPVHRRPTLSSAPPPAVRGSSGAATSPSPGRAIKGTPIASLDSVPVGGAVAFTAPRTGEPAVLLRPSASKVEAFSRICTHAGCPVQWDRSSHLLVCPCHGAEFDPARGAVPVAGPAPSPLPRIAVAIDHATREVVAR